MEPNTQTNTPQVSPAATELNLDSLIKFGHVEKEIEIIPGFKVTMHVLSQDERDQMTKALGVVIPDNITLMQRMEAQKLPTIVWAITQINSEQFTLVEDKLRLYDKLKQAPGTTIDLIHVKYQDLFLEQYDVLSKGFKKN